MVSSVWMVYSQVLWLSLAERSPRDATGENAAADTNGNAASNSKVSASESTVTSTPSNGAENTNEGIAGNATAGPGDTEKGGGAGGCSPKSARNTTSLRILDTAMTVESSVISLLHFWRFKKLKIAYAVAIMAWYAPLMPP
jgi:hypothetical protein